MLWKELWTPFEGYRIGSATGRWGNCEEWVRMVKGGGWQTEIVTDANNEAAVMSNVTVIISACNWLWLHGVRTFELIGVDYRMIGGRTHAKMIAPFESDTGNAWRYEKRRGVPACIERQFAEMVAAIREGGGAIVNLSPGSALKAVPAPMKVGITVGGVPVEWKP